MNKNKGTIIPTSFARSESSMALSLSLDACTMLVHLFVSSRLDYCNSLLAGMSDELVNKLQSVLRSAACLILGKRKFDPISVDLRQRLHWLPVKQKIQYKLGLLVYKCLHGLAPPYLSSMLTPVSSNRYSCRLQSAARGDITVHRARSVRMGLRSFAVSGPELWKFFGTGTQKSQHFFGYFQIPA